MEQFSQSNNVTVIHETDGRKYFEALVHLQKMGSIQQISFEGASVLWRFGHLLMREKKSFALALRQTWANLLFRLSFLRLRGQTILLCVGPWDPRFLFYSLLRFRNHVIYHTSWPFWTGNNVPRKTGPFSRIFRSMWFKVLKEDSVRIVAVTSDASNSVVQAVQPGSTPVVIPHVVSEAFFQVRARYGRPLRLVFVGELIEKKGVRLLAQIMRCLQGEPITIHLVGDGPLRSIAEEIAQAPGCCWHGRVSDRRKLAGILSEAQLFVSPALRTDRWEELFGMSIAEAMAAGLPCIASDHSGPRSIISHGRDGVLVPEGDINEIVRWIRLYLEDPSAWRAMSEQAVRTAAKYSLAAVSGAWEKVLLRPHTQTVSLAATLSSSNEI
jgi:glycosyltransferase involved in cell wall biosynthesis